MQGQATLDGVWAEEEGANGDREEDPELEFGFSSWITSFELRWGWRVSQVSWVFWEGCGVPWDKIQEIAQQRNI